MAVDLPDVIREGLKAWGEAELIDPALRPVRPESLHVTLVFLGNREADEVEAIIEAVGEMSAPAVLMKLEDPITLPRRRRAVLFALPAPSPATHRPPPRRRRGRPADRSRPVRGATTAITGPT